MGRETLRSHLFPAICLAAFAAVLAAAPTRAGRTVTLAEADHVRGASCAGPGTSTSQYCVIQCGFLCLWNVCASCGCPTKTDSGSGNYIQYRVPCYQDGSGACGAGYWNWGGTCTGS